MAPRNTNKCSQCVENRDSQNIYCDDHRCKYVKPSGMVCQERKKRAAVGCDHHISTCKAFSCDNKWLLVERDPYKFCDTHTCAISSCYDRAVSVHSENSERTRDDLCTTHSNTICETDSCLEVKNEQGQHCQDHTCIVSQCLKRKVADDRPFCEDHNVCQIENCKFQKSFINDCENICGEDCRPLCDRESDQKTPKASDYCNLHTCSFKHCRNEAQLDSNRPFCKTHECHSPECTEHVLPENDYCKEQVINGAQANGAFPQANLQDMTNWVENGTVPVTLDTTHLVDDDVDANAQICAWPLRPF
ncbi:hypothetical protein BP6252_04467 [Coleophoma cylindrospora]|uniref:Uncharacterized protein n=1 Tax=Coleophoma cylindrospora TaxID=1849047 RepID=A0A3D8S0K9_9HELO|nr:hypothetical protein BP6252_04467 [Coleophoma cylindrospora]